ncbi:hypothetical protein [Methylocapsa palsarum]|uniref:Uncharacterized protein n=1 Tax=Methylocapsa palsarum TaxID=1612308 RepID=A0A1I4C4M1_9HYPH|nr:hypothetical protein [Methylocapsa palsarum]SFK75259.1 hypothetical protein SAMN05444581_1181 [Methylocapsa palsarum]
MGLLSWLRRQFSERTARRLERATSIQFRKLDPSELIKAGFSPLSERYVPSTVKRVTSKTASISKRQYQTKRNAEFIGEKLSIEKVADRHATGELSYKTADTRARAQKQMSTRRIKAALKKTEKAENHSGRKYVIGSETKGAFMGSRQRKLAGEFIPDGEWHAMVDLARAINDPRLSDLIKSAGVI